MIEIPRSLGAGYRRFRRGRYADERALYAKLATGQSPRLAVLACADSRVDPAMIFDAAPGELFVIRNVANLVPDFEADGGFHGTSAGIEFAIRHLGVEDLVVLGHGSCGGIKACIHHDTSGISAGPFIDHWVELASAACAAVRADAPELTGAALEREVELASIRCSLERLEAFPFVKDALARGTLRLHGAWFAIASGEMLWLDRATNAFRPIDQLDLANGLDAAYV